MKHSTIMLVVTFFVIAIGIFSAWFFPLNGAPLAGVVLATGYFVATALSATVTMLLAREGN